MQVHRAQHQVEARGGEGQRLLVGDDGRSLGLLRKAQAEIGANQMVDGVRSGEGIGHLVAVTAEIERQRESAAHVGQTLDQPARDLALQERLVAPTARGTLAAQAQHATVEDQKGIGNAHGLYVR